MPEATLAEDSNDSLELPLPNQLVLPWSQLRVLQNTLTMTNRNHSATRMQR